MSVGIVELGTDPNLLGEVYGGASWAAWWAVIKAAFAEPMTDWEVDKFKELAGGREPPAHQVRELWIIAGRRAGKDSVASLIACHAALQDRSAYLRRGERAVCVCMAVDRTQAEIIRDYIGGHFEHPLLSDRVTRQTQDTLELGSTAAVQIVTSEFRAVRGRTVSCVVADEIAFWPSDGGSPDREVYTAVMPAMGTLPGSMFVGISTPYARKGLLYDRWCKYFGVSNDDILVIQADSRSLNSATLPQSVVDAHYADDPIAASAEFGGQFRPDIEAYIPLEVIEACTARGVFERLPDPMLRYSAAVDMSGGVQDSSAICIVHRDASGGAVIDCIRERVAPHSPADVVAEFVEVAKRYGVMTLVGDRYGGEWIPEKYREAGIDYQPSELNKSEAYVALTPLLNSGKVELLDNDKLRDQLCSLERRPSRIGKDSVDHPKGPTYHDDVANACALALVMAVRGPDKVALMVQMMEPQARWRAAQLFGGF